MIIENELNIIPHDYYYSSLQTTENDTVLGLSLTNAIRIRIKVDGRAGQRCDYFIFCRSIAITNFNLLETFDYRQKIKEVARQNKQWI